MSRLRQGDKMQSRHGQFVCRVQHVYSRKRELRGKAYVYSVKYDCGENEDLLKLQVNQRKRERVTTRVTCIGCLANSEIRRKGRTR